MLILSALALFVCAPDVVVIHAVLPTQAPATAFAVASGRVDAVGSDADMLKRAAPTTKIVDAKGRTVLPGFIDSHIHFGTGGISQSRVVLNEARSLQEIQARIVAWAAAHPQAPWITGRGWMYDLFKNLKPAYPTRQMLDAVMPDRPVFVRAYDGHTAWANSKALALGGYLPSTPDPVDGKIIREADGKTPAGALTEGAMDAMYKAIPEYTQAELEDGILVAQALAHEAGLTSVNDFVASDKTIDAYLNLEKAGKLRTRVFYSPPLETPIAQALAWRERLQKESKLVRFGSLKGFVDGVVESDTAAFIDPYADSRTHRGRAHLSPAELDKLIGPADAAGLSVSLHAIGDLAVRTSLDAYEKAAQVNRSSDRRHRIEHIEVLHPADAKRFGRLGVVASMQPLHAEPSDKPGSGVWEKKVGARRLPHIFAWQEILSAGGRIAFGSDWAVVSLDPLYGLAVAISRQNGHGKPETGWVPQQKLTVEQAIDAYTTGAAYALHADGDLGALVPGKFADFIILDPKASLSEPLSLYWGSVAATFVGGTQVWPQ